MCTGRRRSAGDNLGRTHSPGGIRVGPPCRSGILFVCCHSCNPSWPSSRRSSSPKSTTGTFEREAGERRTGSCLCVVRLRPFGGSEDRESPPKLDPDQGESVVPSRHQMFAALIVWETPIVVVKLAKGRRSPRGRSNQIGTWRFPGPTGASLMPDCWCCSCAIGIRGRGRQWSQLPTSGGQHCGDSSTGLVVARRFLP